MRPPQCWQAHLEKCSGGDTIHLTRAAAALFSQHDGHSSVEYRFAQYAFAFFVFSV
jgi:hypothetical protein